MAPEFTRVETQIRRRHIRFPHLTREQIWETMNSCGFDMLEMTNAMYDDKDRIPIDYSNLYNHKGKIIDVTTLSVSEVCKLACEIDDIDVFESLEHIRTTYMAAAPNVKLYYPEAFIASPSFIHNDLAFLHILQYQYWLWFFFIFLIVFYVISFLCVVRWCASRNQPRRETRGVSRSKCGDLITATVPVTWALSIIVSETTDATDFADGFGTAEIIVGVRAYQWGWEYYYPKNIDLNYNLKPSYASFVGNSLKYNTSTEKTIATRSIWRFYQNKTTDQVISPAHFLVMPLDNSKLLNFMDFNTIGTDSLKESDAFKKIRLHSKIYTTNLVHTPSVFTHKYNKLSSYFNTQNNLESALNYGIEKQHTLTSSAATGIINSVLLDMNSIDKLLNSNLQYTTKSLKTNVFNETLDTWAKANSNNNQSLVSESNNLAHLMQKVNTFNSKNLQLILSYPDVVKALTKTKYPLNKLIHSQLFTKNLINKQSLLNSLSTESTFSSSTNFVNSNLFNTANTSKNLLINSSNKSFSFDRQSIRSYKGFNLKSTNLNLSSGLNSLDSNLSKFNLNSSTNNLLSYYALSKLNWIDLNAFNKLASNRVYYLPSCPPIISNNPHISNLTFDKTSSQSLAVSFKQNKKLLKITNTKGSGEEVVANVLLANKIENALPALRSNFWQMFWANTNPDLRIGSSVSAAFNQELFYLPVFTTYADYDFKNLQALEMLEESFWETSFSSYNHLDYLNISNLTKKPFKTFTNDIELELPRTIRDFRNDKKLMVSVPFFKDYSSFGEVYSNYIQSDDLVTPASLIPLKDYNLINFTDYLNNLDDSYLNFKQTNNLFITNLFLPLNLNTHFNYPQSYLSVLNNFRGDYQDFSWHVENYNVNSDVITPNQQILFDNFAKDDNQGINISRFSNPITLRSTARNSLVTFAALQKVFRSFLDEGRSLSSLTTFSNLGVEQPFITSSKISFEKLLGKNKESFYNTSFYVNRNFKVFNDLASSNTSLNTYFFDFPFLLSVQSTVSRAMWFDWYSKWSFLDVQAAPGSKYSIVGVPFYKKHFDYNVDKNDGLTETENYFNRISYARKNYLSTWAYTPYLVTRANIWSSNTKFDIFDHSDNLLTFKTIFKAMAWHWESLGRTQNTSEYFTPTFSNSQKNTWRPYKSVQAYVYNINILTDLLTHREFLLRQYLEKNNKIIDLPNVLLTRPKNPLLKELKSSFLLIDPITYNSEYSREFYITKVSYFNYLLFKNWVIVNQKALFNSPINMRLVNDYLFFYFLNNNTTIELGNNTNLFKSQYKPLKRGISNLLRLHGTGAVAMPIEIRLQILASSRDVIHSWAIPSAGIKIDCIPGYTSHRIMTFFTPGIYWGQCMEICGRFHHWMPIVVYFMKRDLFFLWCSHFMSKKYSHNSSDLNDRQFNDYVKLASYDRIAWLTELNKRQ
jgi:heme/copper-type cytochrome/quinol oxidase subunit 2